MVSTRETDIAHFKKLPVPKREFKVVYTSLRQYEAVIEAESEDEARRLFADGEIDEETEQHGIETKVLSVREVEEG